MSGIPPARDTDAEDVSWALQTAETQWKRNDRKDALVWLRRAAQAAVQAMDDDRGLELAHCAAELAEELAAEAKALEAKPPLESLIPVSLGEVELGDSTEVRPTMPPLSVEDSDVQSLPPSAPPEGTAPSPTIPRAPGVPAIGKRDVAPKSKRSPNMPLPAGVLSQIGRTQIDAKNDDDDDTDDTDHGLDARSPGDDTSMDAPTLPPLGGSRSRDALSEAPELASVPPDDTALTEPPSANPNANERAGGRPIPGLRPMRAPMPTPIAEVPRFVRMKARTPTAPPPRDGDFPRDPREEPVEHHVDLPTPTPPPSGRSTAPPDPLYTPAPLPNLGDHDDDDTDVGHSVGIHVQIPQALLRPPLESQTDLLTLSEPAPPPGESAISDHHLTEPVPRTTPRKAEPVTLQFKRPDIPEELKRDPKPAPKDPPTVAVMRPDLPNRANPNVGNPNHPGSGGMGPNDPPTIAARRPDLPKGYAPKTEPVTVSFKRPDPAAIAAAEAELKAKQAAKAAASAASTRNASATSEETTREEPALTEPAERASEARASQPEIDETKPSRVEPTAPAHSPSADARPENPRPGPPRPTPGQSVRPGPPRPTPSSAPARPKPAAPATAKPAATQPTRAATPAPPVVRIDERAEPESEARLPAAAPSEPSLPEAAEDTSPALVESTAKTPAPPAVSPETLLTPVPPAPEPETSRPTTPPPPQPPPQPAPREQQITRTNEANLPNESLTLEPVRETFARTAEPSTRQVAALSASRAEAILADTAERGASSPAVVSLDLSDVEAFADLPEDARDTFAAAATITKLTSGEEVADFALAYVISGDVDVSATIVDATASQLEAGGVLRAHGTPEESVPLRLVCTSQEARVATWSADAVEAAFKSCPWVEDDLRAASDQVQTLAGVTMGALGDRLDVSLRQQVTSRLKVRSLLEGETMVEAGSAVPGIVVVGVGKLELVDKAGKVVREVRSGDFLFPEQVLGAGPAPQTARAGKGGALVMVGDRRVAQELMVTCPPLLEILAGM